MKAKANRTPEEVVALPYTRSLTPDPSGGYVATIHEFPGCIAHGDTADGALKNLDAAALSWVGAALESGFPVPEPFDAGGYSGKIALRISRRLHKLAAERAQREGVSLNQFLSAAIASYLGQKDAIESALEVVAQQARATVSLSLAAKTIGQFQADSRRKIAGGLIGPSKYYEVSTAEGDLLSASFKPNEAIQLKELYARRS